MITKINPVRILTGSQLCNTIEYRKKTSLVTNGNKCDVTRVNILTSENCINKANHRVNRPSALTITYISVLLFIASCITSIMTIGMFQPDNTALLYFFIISTLFIIVYLSPAHKFIIAGDVRGVLVYRNILLISFILIGVVSIVADLHGRDMYHLLITWIKIFSCRHLMNSSSFLNYVTYYWEINDMKKLFSCISTVKKQ